MNKLILICIIILICISSLSVNAALTDNLQTYWSMDNESIDGTAVVDTIGNDNGTIYDLVDAYSVGDGKIIDALYGDGVGGSFNMGSSTQIFDVGVNSYTLSFWVYLNNQVGNQKFLQSCNSGTTGCFWGYNNNGISGIVNMGGSIAKTTYFTMNDSEWQYITTTYNVTDDVVSVYVNGILNNQSTLTDMTPRADSANTMMGQAENVNEIEGRIDEIGIWSRTLLPSEIQELYNDGDGLAYPFTVTTPITNSSWNITTTNQASYSNETAWELSQTAYITSDSLSFTVTASEASNMSCSLTDANYTTMVTTNSSYKSATTDTTDHSYTLVNDLAYGNQCVYCSFVRSDGTGELSASTSGCLKVNYLLVSAGYCWGVVGVNSYTGTETNRSLEVSCFNPNLIESFPFTNVNITPPTGWGNSRIIRVEINSTNSTIFSNVSARGTSDGALYNISGATIVGDISMTTNSIQEYNRIDPPHAWTKDGQVQCDINPVSDEVLDLGFDLVIDNTTGTFLIGDTLSATGFNKFGESCVVAINDSGSLVIG